MVISTLGQSFKSSKNVEARYSPEIMVPQKDIDEWFIAQYEGDENRYREATNRILRSILKSENISTDVIDAPDRSNLSIITDLDFDSREGIINLEIEVFDRKLSEEQGRIKLDRKYIFIASSEAVKKVVDLVDEDRLKIGKEEEVYQQILKRYLPVFRDYAIKNKGRILGKKNWDEDKHGLNFILKDNIGKNWPPADCSWSIVDKGENWEIVLYDENKVIVGIFHLAN